MYSPVLFIIGLAIEPPFPRIDAPALARELLLPFPAPYLVECGFSGVNDLLLKKRNRLDH